MKLEKMIAIRTLTQKALKDKQLESFIETVDELILLRYYHNGEINWRVPYRKHQFKVKYMDLFLKKERHSALCS